MVTIILFLWLTFVTRSWDDVSLIPTYSVSFICARYPFVSPLKIGNAAFIHFEYQECQEWLPKQTELFMLLVAQ